MTASEKVSVVLARIEERLTSISKTQEELVTNVNVLRKVVCGNGEPGLDEQQRTLSGRQERSDRRTRNLMYAVIALAFVLIVMLIVLVPDEVALMTLQAIKP